MFVLVEVCCSEQERAICKLRSVSGRRDGVLVLRDDSGLCGEQVEVAPGWSREFGLLALRAVIRCQSSQAGLESGQIG